MNSPAAVPGVGERERFEAWNNERGNGRNERHELGYYLDSYTFNYWIVWQARAALSAAPPVVPGAAAVAVAAPERDEQ